MMSKTLACSLTAVLVLVVSAVAGLRPLTQPADQQVIGTGSAIKAIEELVHRANTMNGTGLADMFDDNVVGYWGTCEQIGKAAIVANWMGSLAQRQLACFPKVLVDNGHIGTALIHDMLITTANTTMALELALRVVVDPATGKIVEYVGITDFSVGVQGNASAMIGAVASLYTSLETANSAAFWARLAPNAMIQQLIGGMEAMPLIPRSEFEPGFAPLVSSVIAGSHTHSFGRPMAMCDWVVFPATEALATAQDHWMNNDVSIVRLAPNMTVLEWYFAANMVGKTPQF